MDFDLVVTVADARVSSCNMMYVRCMVACVTLLFMLLALGQMTWVGCVATWPRHTHVVGQTLKANNALCNLEE